MTDLRETTFSDNRIDKRQLKALLKAAWKTDLRGSSNPLQTSGSSESKFPPILFLVFFKVIIAVLLAAVSLAVNQPYIMAITIYTVVTVFIAILVLLEFSNLILSPDEYPIIAARPVGSKTFFAAKLIHLLAYVNVLGMIMYLPSSVTIAIAAGNAFLFFSVFLGGLMLTTTIGLLFAVLYTLALKIVNRDTMQRVLAYAQLLLIFLIYGGYLGVPRLLGKEAFLYLREFHSNWFYAWPPAWFASVAKLPAGDLLPADLVSAVAAVAILLLSWRTASSKLSLSYAHTLSNTVTEQENAAAHRKRGVFSRLLTQFSNHEDRAVWSLIRKQFKHDNRFKVSILTIIPLAAFYIFMGLSDGQTMLDPFSVALQDAEQGTNFLLYVAIAMLPFMVIVGTVNSESYRSAWVFYTSPADRANIIMASARFALVYFCLPFAILLVGVFTWFFHDLLHAFLHCVAIYVVLMITTKLMVLLYPRIPFSQPPRAGQRSMSMFTMIIGGMLLMIIPMAVVSNLGYGGYLGYAISLVVALLLNYLLQQTLRRVLPKRAAKLEFTAQV